MALTADEQSLVDRHVAEHGVRRVGLSPGEDRVRSLFWRKRFKTATAAKARQFATEVTRLDHPPEAA